MGNPIKDLIKSGVTGAIEGLGNTASNIITKFKADPTKALEYEKELETAKINASLEADRIANQAEETFAKELETVNQTMRIEANSEHWMVWSWRPSIGFTFCAILINNYILIPYLKKYGAEYIEIPTEVWMAILAVLGVASAGRSVTSWQKAKNK